MSKGRREFQPFGVVYARGGVLNVPCRKFYPLVRFLYKCYDNVVLMKKNDKRNRVQYLDCVLHLLAETARLSELAARNYYKDCVKSVGILELDEFVILCYLIKNPELSQSDLSKLVYKGKAHVGKILNAMEEKGYIKRIVASHNSIMVKYNQITDEGKKLYYLSDDIFSKMAVNIFEQFSEKEIDEFSALLTKLQSAILKTRKINF